MSNYIKQGDPADVTVIIPAHNAALYIAQLIESLLNQDYPEKLVEIIVIDNNSEDDTAKIVSGYPVSLLSQIELPSPGQTRNKGIQKAKGQILAFIDSDCIASGQWVKEGINALASESADIAAGKVEFYFMKQKTAAQMYDSITHIQQEKTVSEQGVAQTANLFVKTEVFEKVGLFPPLPSAEDVIWTAKAVKQGFKLIYAPKAVVRHPTRNLKPLLKKRFLYGASTITYWKSIGVSRWYMFTQTLRRLLPRRLSMIKKAIQQRGTPDMSRKLFGIWLVAYLCGLFTVMGILISALPFSKRKT